ncbi:hypothetical protein NLJ89_g7185 [Agrocybe chaxingu]|uniref:Uncharacterized protein n=1 Tax=Agrocybe chaxingu TaxID=84603 RepID=A0A9W8JZK1_9AGAR|nr:hypothetical protein NLJ89_g7185 [Agrocybe chaxingu]
MMATEQMLERSKDAPLIIREDSEATIGTELHAAFQHFHRVEELGDEKCELQIRPGVSAKRSPPADFAPYLSQSKHADQQACWTWRPYSTERPSRFLSSGLPIPRNLVKLQVRDPPSMWHSPRHALCARCSAYRALPSRYRAALPLAVGEHREATRSRTELERGSDMEF